MAYAVPSPFAWDKSFDVGNEEINTQHKRLFALINELEADLKSAEKLTELLNYAVMHFKFEEESFSKHHYKNAVAHKAIHDKFVHDAVAATKDGVNEGIISFLKDWLVDHILGSDMQYKGVL